MPAKLILLHQSDDQALRSAVVMPEDFEFDIRRLRQSHYRKNHPGAIEASKRFRRIFQGPFHAYFELKRERTHANLIRLLVGQRLAINDYDAERFISDILGAELYLDGSHRSYCTLGRVKEKPGTYCLWRITY